jgi:AcrR family transcriptional regulator
VAAILNGHAVIIGHSKYVFRNVKQQCAGWRVSPRPRKASDDEIFAATAKTMTTRGPAQLTLADVAAEAGLTAGALVQRFGSKRALLLALMERFGGSTAETFAALRGAHASPLAAIHAYGECMAQMATSPAALANSLAWLQQDLTDPDFHRFTLQNARATRRELASLVAAAIAAGEIASTDTSESLARAIDTTVTGSLMAWAIHREGAAARWIRHDLDALLRPYLPSSRRRGATARRKPSARRARR